MVDDVEGLGASLQCHFLMKFEAAREENAEIEFPEPRWPHRCGPGDRQDCQRISGKVSQKFMAVLSVPGMRPFRHIPRNVIRILT